MHRLGGLALLWLAGLLSALASSGHAQTQAQAQPPDQAQPPAAATTLADPPPIAARYRVTLALRGQPAQVQQWQLLRQANEICWTKGQALAEIWRRDSSGIRLERVLPEDKHLIDYSAGELRALQVVVDWHGLGTLLAETDLARLQPVRGTAARRPGLPVDYRGQLAGDAVALRWDPVARLPLRLQRSSPAGRVLFERLALHAVAPADWPRPGAGSADYQRLDAADFGDMDDNPVVRRAQARDVLAGWRQAQRH